MKPDLSKFKTAHQLARELLAGPDHIVVIPTPSFDMPGMFTAFPAKAEVAKVQEVPAVMLVPDADAMPQPPEEKSAEGATDAGQR